MNEKSKPAIFLDRDGVINQAIVKNKKPYSPRCIEEVIVIEGVRKAVMNLSRNGFVIAVITNQPDVANGLLDLGVLKNIHKKITKETGISNFYICMHSAYQNCMCRKPRTGLIYKAAEELRIDISSSYFVGDRWLDIEAGNSAGCRCFFIDNSYDETPPKPPFVRVSSLLHASQLILEDTEQ